jgi:DNA-binding transcriptional regulator YiaG
MADKNPMEVALETAQSLGFDKATMREIEQLTIPEVKVLSPRQIKIMRTTAKFSQGVMARALNVNLSTYQKWERGETIPKGAPLKLLNIVHKNGIEMLTR